MKKRILLFSVLASLSTSAMADDAYWPRNPVPGADNNGGARAVAPAAKPSSTSYQAWRDLFPIAHDAQPGRLTAEELKAQLQANKAHRQALVARLHAEGRCNAPILPVEFAAVCWGENGANSASQTSGPIGASIGGSDGGSNGGEK